MSRAPTINVETLDADHYEILIDSCIHKVDGKAAGRLIHELEIAMRENDPAWLAIADADIPPPKPPKEKCDGRHLDRIE